MAMPEIGFDELPIKPVMREETVTKRNPNTTTRSAAKKVIQAMRLGILDREEREHRPHDKQQNA